MIQLKVYSGPKSAAIKPVQYWIDLYETEPIKLTLSIEDITNTDATSTYSKAFKVPGTRKNAKFFKNSFDVDGTLFDVTIKKPAEILVDGAEFKQGHVRLQKVFLNTQQDRYDYELLFFGETRDFSSIIGDKGLCQLQIPDLVGGASGGLTPADIVTSWNAWDGTNGTLTSGLHDGNILYPLIDHGNTYNAAGNVEQPRIALEGSQARFNQSGDAISLDRFKPMIRAKRVWDQIFEDAGYTYDSLFIDSDLFHQIYVSAFGNTATVGWDIAASSTTSDNIAHAQQNNSDWGYQELTQAINDPGNNLNTILIGGTDAATVYTIPASGAYNIAGQCYYTGYNETSNGQQVSNPAIIYLWNVTQSAILAQSSLGYNQTLQFNVTIDTTTTAFFNVGDQICLVVGATNGGPDFSTVNNVALDILSAPGIYNPVSSLECTYKQIDFIKDILTAFRLVLSPDPNKPQNFIVEPWQQYINSGDLHDWSKKLVENKDVTIEPVFFSQSQEIDFSFQRGGDFTNVYHELAYAHPYGWLQFNANNDLLKGKREIKLNGIAPTPILNIDGSLPTDNFVLPQLHIHNAGEIPGVVEHLPIKPKTRLLFYNGLKPVGGTGATHNWYFTGTNGGASGGAWAVYPMVSPYETYPIIPQTLNLNWANDIQYWGNSPGYNNNGVTLYDNYWSRYIESLYGKYSRRVTAYFILNNIDLNEFSFDDTIFVNGTYYIPERIIDVEVGDYTEVKVQLLTANDYRPTINLLQDLIINSATGIGSPCASAQGSIDVNTEGTAPFTWSLSNGMSGAAVTGANPGPPPYTFTIQNVPVGTYTLTIVDSLGRNAEISVTIPGSIAAPVTSTFITADASDCATCDGAVTVSPAGGISPYTIQWNDGNTSFSRTGLCPNIQYSYTVFDSLGCGFESNLVVIGCEGPPVHIYQFGRIGAECNTMVDQFLYVQLATPPSTSDVWSLSHIGGGQLYNGCWSYTFVIQDSATPDAELATAWIDCATCYGIVENPLSWKVQSCLYPVESNPYTGSTRWVSLNQFDVEPGMVIKSTTTDEYGPCYTVIELDNQNLPDLDILSVGDSCNECQGTPPVLNYRISDCATGQPWNMTKATSNFLIGDVIQYQIGVPGSGTVHCGTIIDVSFPTGFEDATLYNANVSYACGDLLHCAP